MDLDRLRAATRPEHEATEATLNLMSADLTLAQYANSLGRLYAVLAGWERWAAAHVPKEYDHLLKERRRSRLLRLDLAFLGASVADGSEAETEQRLNETLLNGSDGSVSKARFLGAMYVVEGSTLGGQYIAKHVADKFGFDQGQGNAYFRGYGEHTGSMWRSFKDELVARPDTETDEAIAAARSLFQVFGTAMASAESVTKRDPMLISKKDGIELRQATRG